MSTLTPSILCAGKRQGVRAHHLFWCSLHWRHNEHDGVLNHQPRDCLFNCLFRRRSKKTSKLRTTGLCAGNSSVTGEFPTQKASYAENVSIWCSHHVLSISVVDGMASCPDRRWSRVCFLYPNTIFSLSSWQFDHFDVRENYNVTCVCYLEPCLFVLYEYDNMTLL